MEYRTVQSTAFLLKTLLENCSAESTSWHINNRDFIFCAKGIGRVDRVSQNNFAYVDIHLGLSVKEARVFDIVLRYDVSAAHIFFCTR
jgi:hypothetical protein